MKGIPFGRYELLRKIASGGMGEIYLAREWADAGFFRDVVIKKLFDHMAENRAQLEMFQFEARLLAELSHPNIPQAYELRKGEGTWYTVMEHVDGETLAETVRTGLAAGMPMPLPVAVGIVQQLCEALHHVHERRDRAGRPLRIVHCDVTPHNVLLTKSGIAKLIDFGVAQTAARRDLVEGTLRGTLSYMAPEQVRSQKLDKRADVFALGVVLYELTTGTRLFRGTDVQIMTAIAEEDVAPPSARVPNYPRELEDVVMGALTRSRSGRTPSAAHLSTGLEQFAMRAGLVTRPRGIEKYLLKIFPHEDTAESDIGLVAEASQVARIEADTSSHTLPLEDLGDSDEATLPPDLVSIPKGGVSAAPRALTEDELADMLISDDSPTKVPGAASALSRTQAGVGLDSQNEPVVLLQSPKRREGESDAAPPRIRRKRSEER